MSKHGPIPPIVVSKPDRTHTLTESRHKGVRLSYSYLIGLSISFVGRLFGSVFFFLLNPHPGIRFTQMLPSGLIAVRPRREGVSLWIERIPSISISMIWIYYNSPIYRDQRGFPVPLSISENRQKTENTNSFLVSTSFRFPDYS